MKRKIIYRKLICNDTAYYQVIDIVDENENLPDIKEQRELDRNNDDIFFRYGLFRDEKEEKRLLYKIYKYHNEKDFSLLVDPFEIYKIRQIFYYTFKDFPLVPKNNLDVEKTYQLMINNVLYHNREIKELINVIKSNLDILDSDLSNIQKAKMKHNIILYGPSGYGKSSIMNLLYNEITPSISTFLGEDCEDNVEKIVGSLINESLGDIKEAEHGVVFIGDNFDDFDEEKIISILDDLLSRTELQVGNMIFDLSNITFVLEKRTNTNEFNEIFDYGFNQSLYNCFQKFILIDSLSKEEMLDYLINNENSVINVYKKLLASLKKELVLEDDFVEYLIDKTIDEIGGLKLIEKYIEDFIKSKWNDGIIVLNKSMIDELLGNDELSKEIIKSYQKKKQKVESKEESKTFVINRDELKKKYLEMYVDLKKVIKGQDQPLGEILFKILLNNEIQNSNLSNDEKKKRISHILIRGKAGSGKTFIVREIAKRLQDKIFFIADCTEYTKAGYVGKSVTDILITLINLAHGDIEKAQKAILFLDEFDKLANNGTERSDVGTGAVQEALLKLLEGNVYELEIKEGMYSRSIMFDTSELTIIAGGAFEGIEKIVKERLGGRIGFGQNIKSNTNNINSSKITQKDLEKFGIQRQCLRRISFHVDLNELTKNDYRDIMLNCLSSDFLIKLEMFKLLGINISYDDEFIGVFVDRAYNLGYGVSSINILCENIFSYIETKIMENDFNYVILTKECIDDPQKIIFQKEGNVKVKKLSQEN